ncbi:MAG: single-stranded-DNA-specific exonuclease [Thermacetogenium sp.]|nr:single-stranded-DNA-specific exonuclease [Thermacetogenium sp.]
MLWRVGKPVRGRLFEHVAVPRSFYPLDAGLPEPELPGIDDAVRTVLSHLDGRMAVFGDYDCDGICSALILSRALERLGADVFVRLPTRREGFGMKPLHVQELAARGAKLIITADNGTQAIEAIEVAHSLNVSVVVTDHHEPGDILPDCPIVNPKLGGGYRWYAGAGVAWLFASALFKAKGLPAPVDLLDLVCLATVVDVAPLTGPNWALARKGLELMRSKPSLGVQALMSSAGISHLGGHSITWQLGPRLNAPGRVDDPMPAYRLLATKDASEANKLADELSSVNRVRQELVEMIVEDCLAKHKGDTFFPVFAGDYPRGVVGVAAGRLAEILRLPVLVGSCDEQGVVRASGRTIGSFDILSALAEVKTPIQFGGHRAACGATFDRRDLPVLRSELSIIAHNRLKREDTAPIINIDGLVTRVPTPEEVEELDLLEPFGEQNPEPVFALHGKAVPLNSGENWQLIGMQGVKMFVPPGTLQGEETLYAAVSFYLNEWNGCVTVMARPHDIRKVACTRAGLRHIFKLWRSGRPVPEYAEKIFTELGIPRTGAVSQKDLYQSRTFMEIGIEGG